MKARTGKTKMLLAAATLCCGLLFAGGQLQANTDAGAGITAEQALQKLMDGNKNSVEMNLGHLQEQSTSAARTALASSQKPYAIVLTCSDSRVPPEIIFNKGLGELFVIRVAGNVPDPVVLGSIEYAAEHLGSPLIMVLGPSAAARSRPGSTPRTRALAAPTSTPSLQPSNRTWKRRLTTARCARMTRIARRPRKRNLWNA